MGSLMAGWDSPIGDPKHEAYKRNKSFTKEEIEAYWRSKKKAEDELHKAMTCSPSDDGTHQEPYTFKDARAAMANDVNIEIEAAAWEKLIKSNGWWTRSNWAFLNEPPVFEAATNTYTSQFHIANSDHSNLSHGAGPEQGSSP